MRPIIIFFFVFLLVNIVLGLMAGMVVSFIALHQVYPNLAYVIDWVLGGVVEIAIILYAAYVTEQNS